MSSKSILVFVAVGSRSEAKEIAHYLVEKRLAACVSIINQDSVYRWEGKVTEGKENLLIIKTIKEQFTPLQKAILSKHSYEVPEIISIDITDGYQKYLDWLANSVS
ncbi:MAG: divalent-cation tolerance protein CutA [Promethearchaeota archaeon]